MSAHVYYTSSSCIQDVEFDSRKEKAVTSLEDIKVSKY